MVLLTALDSEPLLTSMWREIMAQSGANITNKWVSQMDTEKQKLYLAKAVFGKCA